jgi:hypothetical protein
VSILALFNYYQGKFASAIKYAEDQKPIRKLSNDIDEKMFETQRKDIIEKNNATFRVQEGAAEGKSICNLISQNDRQEERYQGGIAGQSSDQVLA